MLEVSDDEPVLEWGIRMYVVSRQIERIGDNAVDIAEQVTFLVTGEFREFTDASQPEIEHPELLELGGSPDQRTTKPNTGDFFVEFAFVSRWAVPASPPGTPRSHQLRRQGLDAPAKQEYSASEAAGASGLWLSLVCLGLLGRSG